MSSRQLVASAPETAVGDVVPEGSVAELPVGEVVGLAAASVAVGEVSSEDAGAPLSQVGKLGADDGETVDANATERAKQDLGDLQASAAAGASLRGASTWGHGIFGETCCMCSMHFGRNTLLYAAEDYSHFFGGHNAFWRCQHSCESKCHRRGGHVFGCYDEQHLLALDRYYGHRTGYQILHDQHYGNIC
jgi:hypothetical protein